MRRRWCLATARSPMRTEFARCAGISSTLPSKPKPLTARVCHLWRRPIPSISASTRAGWMPNARSSTFTRAIANSTRTHRNYPRWGCWPCRPSGWPSARRSRSPPYRPNETDRRRRASLRVVTQRREPCPGEQVTESRSVGIPAVLLEVGRDVGVLAGIGQVGNVQVQAVFVPAVGHDPGLLLLLVGLAAHRSVIPGESDARGAEPNDAVEQPHLGLLWQESDQHPLGQPGRRLAGVEARIPQSRRPILAKVDAARVMLR